METSDRPKQILIANSARSVRPTTDDFGNSHHVKMAWDRIRQNDDSLYQEMRAVQNESLLRKKMREIWGRPDIRFNDFDSVLGAMAFATNSKLIHDPFDMGIDPDQLPLETIVRVYGRPVLEIVEGDFRFIDLPNREKPKVWGERLDLARDLLKRNIPAVGRLELHNHPEYQWVGTCWLVAPRIVVTNRHLAEIFAARASDEQFIFRPGMSAHVDFLREVKNSKRRLFSIKDVLHIEDSRGPDIAFLIIEAMSTTDFFPEPIPLALAPPNQKDHVVTIGYPAHDSRIHEQSRVAKIFGNIFDTKRLSPGQIIAASDDLVTHDCSTLGGSSGSVVLDLKTGLAVALHFAGVYLRENDAVPALLIHDRLSRLTARRRVVPRAKDLATSSMIAPAFQIPSKDASTAGTTTWTIPLQIDVRIGQPTKATGEKH